MAKLMRMNQEHDHKMPGCAGNDDEFEDMTPIDKPRFGARFSVQGQYSFMKGYDSFPDSPITSNSNEVHRKSNSNSVPENPVAPCSGGIYLRTPSITIETSSDSNKGIRMSYMMERGMQLLDDVRMEGGDDVTSLGHARRQSYYGNKRRGSAAEEFQDWQNQWHKDFIVHNTTNA